MAINKADRARQFMPFAALKGYTEALQKKEKVEYLNKNLNKNYYILKMAFVLYLYLMIVFMFTTVLISN